MLEDDPYGSLYFEDVTRPEDTRPLRADDRDGRVVYLGSISKTLVPGLRVAWLVAPAEIAARVELAKQATDLCSGVFDQRIVHAALERGVVRELAPALRAALSDQAPNHGSGTPRRAAWPNRVDAAARRVLSLGRFRRGIDDRRLFDEAVNESVSFVVGSAFFVDGGGHQFARLSYSAPTHEGIAEGVRRLRRAFDRVSAPAPAR